MTKTDARVAERPMPVTIMTLGRPGEASLAGVSPRPLEEVADQALAAGGIPLPDGPVDVHGPPVVAPTEDNTSPELLPRATRRTRGLAQPKHEVPDVPIRVDDVLTRVTFVLDTHRVTVVYPLVIRTPTVVVVCSRQLKEGMIGFEPTLGSKLSVTLEDETIPVAYLGARFDLGQWDVLVLQVTDQVVADSEEAA